jgi:integrase
MAQRVYKRLNVLKVKQKATQPGRHPDGDGLYLEVAKGGTASWVLRYLVQVGPPKKERFMGLGSLRHVTLAEARQKAEEARKLRRDGVDPLNARRGQKLDKLKAAKAMTFKQAAEQYITAQEAGWRSALHAQQWRRTLEQHTYPLLGDLPLAAIDTPLVMQVIEPMWSTTTETASRVRGRIESILGWATVKGHRPAGDNPARWKDHLEHMLPAPAKVKAKVHHAALPYSEISGFMAQLRQQEGVAARALEFLILCASRTDEVREAPWKEIDLREKMWVIPGPRMKGKREHRVPLTDEALAILKQMEALRLPGASGDDFIFPGRDPGKPMGPVALNQVLQRMARKDLTTIHGFRSSFSDWCAETTHHPSEVREMALAHKISNAVEAAYRRGDMFEKRRAVMRDWAAYCAGQPAERGAVVAFAR